MNTRRWLWLILLLALVVRVGYVYVQLNHSLFHVVTFAPDSERYINLAENIIDRGMFSYEGRVPTANDTPGFPLFLVGLRLLFGPSLMAIYLAQIVLSVATVLMAFYIARQYFSDQAGLWAVALIAIYPMGFIFVATPLTETLYSFLVAAFLAVFARISRGVNWAMAAGVVGGMATLTRPIVGGFLGLACLFLALKPKTRVSGLVVLGVFILVMAPWVIRNAVVFNEFIPLSTTTGYQIYGGHVAGATGGGEGHMRVGVDFTPWPVQPPGVSDNEWSRRLTAMGLEVYLSDPLLFFERLPRKIWNMWRPTWGGASFKNWIAIGGVYLLIWTLALVCLLSKKSKAPLLWGFVLYHIAVHALIFGIVRYRIPVEPVLCVLAGQGVMVLLGGRTNNGKDEADGLIS
jgi:4-amino-4-deoxy-L-arabinose transferase-like glycosyltransferase